MLSSSTLRTFCARQHLSSSTLYTILSVMVLTLSVDTPSAYVRVFLLLFLMVSGSTSLIMMHLPSLSSPLRGTLGSAPIHYQSGLFTRLNQVVTWLIFCYVCHLRYVDTVLTIPKGTLFPMCGMNLAFDRELIGPAMYFGLMGDGQPIGRYDDMWAGWCTKV